MLLDRANGYIECEGEYYALLLPTTGPQLVIFHYDNAPAHSSATLVANLMELGSNLFDIPLLSRFGSFAPVSQYYRKKTERDLI